MTSFHELPYDVHQYIITILSQLEYDCVTTIHPMLYLKCREYYYNLPTVVDSHKRLIVNESEYDLIKRLGNYRKGRHGSFKIIDNPIIKWISIHIYCFLRQYIQLLLQIPQPYCALILCTLLPVHIIIIVSLFYIENIIAYNAIII